MRCDSSRSIQRVETLWKQRLCGKRLHGHVPGCSLAVKGGPLDHSQDIYGGSDGFNTVGIVKGVVTWIGMWEHEEDLPAKVEIYNKKKVGDNLETGIGRSWWDMSSQAKLARPFLGNDVNAMKCLRCFRRDPMGKTERPGVTGKWVNNFPLPEGRDKWDIGKKFFPVRVLGWNPSVDSRIEENELCLPAGVQDPTDPGHIPIGVSYSNQDPDPQGLIEAYLFLDDPVGIDYLLFHNPWDSCTARDSFLIHTGLRERCRLLELFRSEKTSKIIESNLGPIPTLLPAQSIECHVQSFLGYLQEWGLHHLPGQPLTTFSMKKFLLMSNLNLP
ncbi:hypothetical protein HGM15179_014066 [Zosterops borbonicus]|uniref:Uncharacterized protein n=1 Tax=Zosterops borbonicus TaxID=364589 RepID=A0A8K1G6X9_9PASS|nr:hypothetical protein HGM15179_014066 [Zosterops borbonicus]